ncbi:hypothetical protein THAOC_32380 [Thalassiosira oceanica]|uniref:Uncharacterized protein n=1 Tax=Thalassiosira oceanica TaxID=159749 RepID=K0R655_THAOC|nr:hypothetical protein THAOC_32380 [Thalassiosira oceanica]|eukprot:EJK48793.1 hypothetical protein THAOC_32380 [Thalassiosira oceanica]
MTEFPEFAVAAAAAPRPLACPSAASAISSGMMARVIAVDHRQNNFQPERKRSAEMTQFPEFAEVAAVAPRPVLRELGSKRPEYKAIIAKWLSRYEKGSFYKNIIGNGSLGDFGL